MNKKSASELLRRFLSWIKLIMKKEVSQKPKKEVINLSSPTQGTIFRSKIFQSIDGQKMSKSAVAVRTVKKLSKSEKKFLKKQKVRLMKEGR